MDWFWLWWALAAVFIVFGVGYIERRFTMQEWQQRVVAERDDLSVKIIKLQDFCSKETYNNLSLEDKDLLNRQHNSMRTYQALLNARIARFITNADN